ncbi:hypothetical protein GOP47_0012198 [Adiantum capillus-veneris]|uniref:Uncharacterized protein n=1 Tax=Adiantum capillus-veneris TaxID=13818 RepID=A0A9D4UQR0_ADICA|nr:hypothetical protein GOP47_0012198 [Adiantum capillus-veneris]
MAAADEGHHCRSIQPPAHPHLINKKLSPKAHYKEKKQQQKKKIAHSFAAPRNRVKLAIFRFLFSCCFRGSPASPATRPPSTAPMNYILYELPSFASP